LSQFLLSEVTEGKDLSTAEGRARAQFDAKPLLQTMPASALRLQLLRQLAQITESSVQEIESLFELETRVSTKRAPAPAIRRKPPVELERQVLRLLLSHPSLASSLGNRELEMISHASPDSGAMLKMVVDAARSISANSNFAALSEALREQGADLDGMMGEIAAEPVSDLELAKRELAGAVRQTTIRLLKSEQDHLAAGGLASEEQRARYREISLELEKLRAAADKDNAID
jgi:DNA primase